MTDEMEASIVAMQSSYCYPAATHQHRRIVVVVADGCHTLATYLSDLDVSAVINDGFNIGGGHNFPGNAPRS